MSEISDVKLERASAEPEKPVANVDDVKFPPYPEPTDDDFDEDVTEEEKSHYKSKFPDLNEIVSMRLHCTACDRHLGCAATNDSRMKLHPMLRTLICNTCHSFYNSGEFDKGEDGSELYCRWCGQGGQVYCCSECVHVFCAKCIKRNLGLPKIKEIENTDDWKCFKCNPKCLWDLRAACWALLRYCDLRNKLVYKTDEVELRQKYAKAISMDLSECCKNKGRRSQKFDSAKKKEKEAESVAKKIISKMPPTIQVKKFASVNIDENKPKFEKKTQKRPASPKNKGVLIKNPIAIAPCPTGPIAKRFRVERHGQLQSSNIDVNDDLRGSHTPRKRGRPRKEIDDSLANFTPRKRGRPRKEIDDSLANFTPRKRGRPRKEIDDSLANFTPRKRGRPCKPHRGRPKTTYLIHKEQQRAAYARYKLEMRARKEMPKIEVEVTLAAPNLFSPVRFAPEKKMLNVTRVPRPRIIGNNFNGFNNPGLFNPMHTINMNMNLINDNINLSLDSLTQGLDLAAVQAMNNSNSTFGNNDDVVCTPDFPLEPLCEVTEDNDDDVECITPAPVAVPKVSNPPPLISTRNTSIPLPLPKGNIIQMTESDVTVNALTGGLKFRVDPQTLSSNKMYRLPDGRIFAINANPNMPGGYSATIVSQNPDGTPKVTPRSETFAAKLSAVAQSPSPKTTRSRRNTGSTKRKSSSKSKPTKSKEVSRETDLKVPVEWFRYNMIDAVDALEYSLSRLHKLKKETTSAHLRTRTVDEMKYLHRTLEQLLTTSSKRFIEIRDTLNKEMKLYLSNKDKAVSSEEEDDDDVEILPNTENDDPIFIDENSVDSVNGAESQEVDLTGAASSEHNDSTENRNEVDPLNTNDREGENINNMHDDSTDSANELNNFGESSKANGSGDSANAKEELLENNDDGDKMETDEPVESSTNNKSESSHLKSNELNGDDKTDNEKAIDDKSDDDETGKVDEKEKEDNDEDDTHEKENDKTVDNLDEDTENTDEKELTDKKAEQDNEKDQEAEMSEEMIETLLKDDNLDDNASMEISDLQEAEQILS